MAVIVQRLERLIVVQDVEGSNPSSRPTSLSKNPFSYITDAPLPVSADRAGVPMAASWTVPDYDAH